MIFVFMGSIKAFTNTNIINQTKFYTLDHSHLSHLKHRWAVQVKTHWELFILRVWLMERTGAHPVSCGQWDRRLTGAARWAEVIQLTATQGQGDIQTHTSAHYRQKLSLVARLQEYRAPDAAAPLIFNLCSNSELLLKGNTRREHDKMTSLE